jgi:Mce-associated membrane protein
MTESPDEEVESTGSTTNALLDTCTEESTEATEADNSNIADDGENAGSTPANRVRRRISWPRVLAYGALLALALVLAGAAGYFKYIESSLRESQAARVESVRAACDSSVAMLSYRADTVEKDLTAASDKLAGSFKGSYDSLIHDVVIPGAREKGISALATIPAAASMSAEPNEAEVLVFVNQTVTIGNTPPTNTQSSVKVTLRRIDGRWLIFGFDPI